MWRTLTDRFRALPDRFPKAAGTLGALWGHVRDEPLFGIAFSIILHVGLIVLIVYFGGPAMKQSVKRGEPLFVELPEIKDQAPRGNPAARTPGPPALPTPEPPRPPAPRAQPTPPAPPPRPAAPRVAESKPVEPSRTASVRPADAPRERTAPPTERLAPRPSEPPAPDAKSAAPAPAEETRAAPAAPAAPSAPAAEASRPAPPGGPQVASVPPSSREPVFDLKSMGRGGGAGGRGEGRGGIEGEPIPLDSRDPKFNDYLDRIRRMIKEKWGYPCVQNTGTRQCEYKTAQLVIEFGIAKDGKVPFVNVLRTSGYSIYDDYAVTAIKLASPFPPVPDSLGGKKGVPIAATFNYIVDTSLVNMLR